jgi:PelA/Pel-15E family pectate lyase
MHNDQVFTRRSWIQCCAAGAVFGAFVHDRTAAADDAKLRQSALDAMKEAASYYLASVACHGGYVYYYSPDLTRRLGEGVAGPDEIWVQPPGTPTVGLAYLAAYDATGDAFYLDAARKAGAALLYGQLKSGGWTASIDFNPRGPRVGQYRNGKGQGRNNSTLDDGISQSAIRFLARLDKTLEFKDEVVKGAVRVALDALLAAQFPCGAFPQVWTGPVARQPIVKASYPDYDWRTEGRIKNYWDMYTLNDGLAGTVARALLDVHSIYREQRFTDALARLGDFLLLAQMPDPQPAWAQQYSYAMHPIWARRFEPAAITGGESQDVLQTLLLIHSVTGDQKYLEPIPRALAYLKKSLLPDGRLARYYELQSNRPLYMNRRGDEYSLTYDDSDLPDHYGWKVDSRLDAIDREYRQVAARGGEAPNGAARGGAARGGAAREGAAREGEAPAESPPTADQVRAIIAALDDQGRWISKYSGERLVGQPKFKSGEAYLDSAVFVRNLESLAAYVALVR